jgi:hypothetical protein
MFNINWTDCRTQQEELIRQADHYRLLKSLPKAAPRATRPGGKASRLISGLLSLI